MTYTAHPGTRVGHVHLKVSDLDRAIAFYRDVMGFDLVQRHGAQAAVPVGGRLLHHHIGLNTWQSRGGQPPAPGATTVCSTSRSSIRTGHRLPARFAQVVAAGVAIDGAADHGGLRGDLFPRSR